MLPVLACSLPTGTALRLESLRRLDGTGLDVATGDPPSHPSRGEIPSGESDMSDTNAGPEIHDTESYSSIYVLSVVTDAEWVS